MKKDSVAYRVVIYDKGWKNQHVEQVTLTEGQNFWLVFWELMQKYNQKKFRAECNCSIRELPYGFRWCYFN
jgi:hypothetical protein